MLQQQTLESLDSLHLAGMSQALRFQYEQPDAQQRSFDERLAQLLEAELHQREQAKLTRMHKQAKLKHASACLEDIDFSAKRGLDRNYVSTLASSDWLRRAQFMVVCGPTGVGKTWLACAFGCQAVRCGFPVLYKRFPLLMDELDIARRDGSLPKLRSQLSKVKLLILDDWAMSPLTATGRHELLELVEDRCGQGSLLITSQLPITEWHDYIGEPTIADALLDRIVHRSHKLELQGESLRKTYSKAEGQRDE
jgi:DNA replication protein DnaC